MVGCNGAPLVLGEESDLWSKCGGSGREQGEKVDSPVRAKDEKTLRVLGGTTFDIVLFMDIDTPCG